MLVLLAACTSVRPPAGPDDTGAEDSAPYDGPCTAETLAYEDVGAAWGLADTTDDDPYPTGGSGIAVADLDGDGLDDVILAVRAGALVIHWNRGGVFEAEALDFTTPSSVAALDLDADGDVDLLAGAPLPDDPLRHQFYLLRNDDGMFTAEAIGRPGSRALATDAADLDHDGYPELYVATDGADGLFVNEDGTLSSDDTLALDDWSWKSWIGLFLDVEGDGWSDLLVANDLQSDFGESRLYRNDAGTLVAADAPTTINAMGGSVVDYDRDGDPDVYITGTGPDGLYANADGWIDVGAASGATGTNDLGRMHLGSLATDLDNDGWTDLAAAGGRWGGDDALLQNQDPVEPDALLHNEGGTFSAWDVGFGDDADNTGLVAADLDQDGTQEILEGTVGGPSHLWRSPCLARWSLDVELVDDVPVYGAVVTAHTTDGDRQGRVGLATGLLGTGNGRAWIGLGSSKILGLTVRWPDGEEQEVDGVSPGRLRISRE